MRDKIETAQTIGTGTRVLFVLGWGVTLQDAGIEWFTQKAKEQNWDLLTVQLPAGYRSFQNILEMIKSVFQQHQSQAIVSFSMGSLFCAYIPSPARVFISPYWGNPRRKMILGSYGFSRFLMKHLSWINLPLVPRGFKSIDIGSLDVSDLIPSLISPSTVYEVMKAQEHRPSLQPSDRIFYCPEDTIIDISKCKDAVSYTFKGGHDFMATPDREGVFGQIADIINQHSELN